MPAKTVNDVQITTAIISDAKNLKFENGNVSFLYSGNPKDLLSQLSKTDFEDFTVTDPELEEVFMHYYTKEEE